MHIGIIGVGNWGKNHLRVLNKLRTEGEISEITICDKNIDLAKSWAKNYKIENYTNDYNDLLNAEKIDAIEVITPTDTHYEITKKILEHKIPVFVEKPMSLTSEQCNDLINISNETDIPVVVGQIFRHHNAVRAAKKMISRGELGNVYFINNARIHLRKPRRSMNVLFALGIHDVDIPCFLLDEEYPISVFSVVSSHIFQGIEDHATIHLKFSNNVNSCAFESWLIPVYGKKRELTIIGSNMSVRINYLEPNKIIVYDQYLNSQSFEVKQEASREINIHPPLEPLEQEILDFLKVVQKKVNPIADMYAGKRAVEIIEKCIESTIKGTWISF